MAWSSFFRRNTRTGVEARQGYLDRPVLVVLVVSPALIAVIFAAMVLGVSFGTA